VVQKRAKGAEKVPKRCKSDEKSNILAAAVENCGPGRGVPARAS